MTNKNKNLNVRLSEKEYKKLKQISEKSKKTISEYVRESIKK